MYPAYTTFPSVCLIGRPKVLVFLGGKRVRNLLWIPFKQKTLWGVSQEPESYLLTFVLSKVGRLGAMWRGE